MCYVVRYIHFLLQCSTLKQIMQDEPTLTKTSQIKVLFYFVLFTEGVLSDKLVWASSRQTMGTQSVYHIDKIIITVTTIFSIVNNYFQHYFIVIRLFLGYLLHLWRNYNIVLYALLTIALLRLLGKS